MAQHAVNLLTQSRYPAGLEVFAGPNARNQVALQASQAQVELLRREWES